MRLRSFLSCLAGIGLTALPLAAQQCTVQDDANYSAQIKKFTTLPQFDTNLTDHLPVSSCVDTPEKFLGHIVGAPDVLDKVETINAYMRHLASQSPRVKVFDIGKSEEGRDTILVAVADEATINNLDKYKEITAKLADPRGISASAADALIAQGKPMYWAAGSIHSPETGSPEMLMELAYRLAVEDSPFIRNIREHEIALITPATQVDGRDREVELYMHHKAHPDEAQPGLIWWGHYVAHDDNRDGLTLATKLSQNMMQAFLQWHPTVLHDLHESVPYLYISTGTGPYNPWLDPLEINEWQRMAYYDIDHLNEQGVIGAWTHGFFDGWAPNYMLYVAIGHNAVGRFYETQGNGGADTRVISTPASDTSREWFRPSPPLPRVNWSARNNINMQESGVLYAMSNVATNASEFLRDFYLKSLHSVQKAATEGPAAWVFPANDPRPGLQARLIDQLQAQGVEIDRASAAFQAQGTVPGGSAAATEHSFPAGSYIIRMDQPYSREADMLLDQEYYAPDAPSPYDDTGWTMGALANVETVKVADPAVLKVAMNKVTATVNAPGGVSGTGSVFAINANADPNLAAFRYRLASTPMEAAEKSFEADGKTFAAGSIIIRNASAEAIRGAAEAAGVNVVGLASAPSVPMHALEAPRLAVVHNWQSTAEDGWYRVSMDQLKIPYSYIADTYIRTNGNLRDKYDVIILPPMGFSLAAMLNGIPMSGKLEAWKNTPDMPDLAPPGLDSSDDIRGGLGLDGLMHLEQFVASGGLLVAVGPSMAVASDTGMAPGVSTRQANALTARGDVLRAQISDSGSPIAYGYGTDLDVYYSTGLLLTAGGGGGRGGFGGGRGGAGSGSRTSGIGSLTVPDVMQTRKSDADLLKESLGGQPEARGGAAAAGGGRGGPTGPPPRTVVRFVPQANDLLFSGLLVGGQALAGQPMVVDARHGQGHIVLFAANPFWRNETSGEFALLFNAAMNYKSLDSGASNGAGRAGRGGRGRGGRGGTGGGE
ncbi:MAG TPA: M14 family zinc carboxypeptidase [Terriglobales bacterium]|nr:M14 family zinc carboxypeptidase [Terriglobales bacterium]